MKNNNKVVFAGVALVIVVIAAIIFGACFKALQKGTVIEGKSLEEMIENITVTEATPVKGSVNLGNTSLYDELPEIDKYPAVQISC